MTIMTISLRKLTKFWDFHEEFTVTPLLNPLVSQAAPQYPIPTESVILNLSTLELSNISLPVDLIKRRIKNFLLHIR